MEGLRTLGTSLQDVVMPTFKIYGPLFKANAETINSVKCDTFSYGPLERQQLDVYYPPTPSVINGRRAVLVFKYGGGMVQGHKTLPIPMLEGLVHANVGAFFAQKFGYTVVIADYRLMSHGAKFPPGGEDIALAIGWICENRPGTGGEPVDLFILGNSAGGAHVLTFLFHQQFEATRAKVSSGLETRLRGVILLFAPFEFPAPDPSQKETLDNYFGNVAAQCPLAIMRDRLKAEVSLDFVAGGVRIFVLDSELDPEEEFLQPRDAFVKEWLGQHGNQHRCALNIDSIMGHNHISPFLSPSTGRQSDEAWGCSVPAFCDVTRKLAIW